MFRSICRPSAVTPRAPIHYHSSVTALRSALRTPSDCAAEKQSRVTKAIDDIERSFHDFSLTDSTAVISILRRYTVPRQRVSELAELCVVDIQRQLHAISSNDFVNVLCYVAHNSKTPGMIDTDQWVARFITSLSQLSPRQLSLGVWATSKNFPKKFAAHIAEPVVNGLTSPAMNDTLLLMSNRDRVLLFSSLVRGVTHSRSPREYLEMVDSFASEMGVNFKTLSFQECAMLLLASGKVKDYCKASSISSAGADAAVGQSIGKIAAHLRSLPVGVKQDSLLTVAWAFALIQYKSQPVLVDLYRQLIAKAITPNQAAFAFFLFHTSSGLRDTEVSASLLAHSIQSGIGLLSNANILNLLLGLQNSGQAELHVDTLHAVFNEIISRAPVMKDAQLVNAVSTGYAIIPRIPTIGEPLSMLLSCMGERLEKMSVSETVKFFSIPNLEQETCWRLQRVIISRDLTGRRASASHSMSADDMMLIASQIRRLGPSRVKTNFRMRFMKYFVNAIEQRRIPTPTLLPALRLIDDIGAWHCLPIRTQTRLWRAASEAQKREVRPPFDITQYDSPETQQRRVVSSGLLVKLDRAGEVIEKEAVKEKKILQKGSDRVQEERLELDHLINGIKPIDQFIRKVRNLTPI